MIHEFKEDEYRGPVVYLGYQARLETDPKWPLMTVCEMMPDQAIALGVFLDEMLNDLTFEKRATDAGIKEQLEELANDLGEAALFAVAHAKGGN